MTQRLFPANLVPGSILLDHRPAQAIRIVVKGAHGRPLGAHVAAAEHIVTIGPDTEHLPVLPPHFDPTHSLPQGACAHLHLLIRRHYRNDTLSIFLAGIWVWQSRFTSFTLKKG